MTPCLATLISSSVTPTVPSTTMTSVDRAL